MKILDRMATPIGITALYLISGAFWITFSDLWLELSVNDVHALSRLQTFKGWFYILMTAVALYLMLLRHERVQQQMRDAVERANRDLERKVQERTHELTILNNELESFSYSVSHDLQAPLRAINGFGRELSDRHSERLDDQGRTYLDRILNATLRMESLITQVLALARISKTEARMVDTNLADVIRSVVEEVQSTESGNTRFDLSLDDRFVLTDPVLARIVFMNLVRNAVKFSSKREQPVVQIGVTDAGGTRNWYVKDNGTGFDMAFYGKLFQPFQRLHCDQEYPGCGIGLTTAQRVMSRLKGTIWAESKPEEGAVFFLTFPSAA